MDPSPKRQGNGDATGRREGWGLEWTKAQERTRRGQESGSGAWLARGQTETVPDNCLTLENTEEENAVY